MARPPIVRFTPMSAEQAPDVREATENPADDLRRESSTPPHEAGRHGVPLRSSDAQSEGGDLIERLGMLDDAVFDAIAGRAGALDRLRELWPQLRHAVEADIVEESREQYVRRALVVWRENLAGGAVRDPAAAVAALDVVSLLFDER